MTLAIGSSSSSFRFWRPIHCRILIRHRSCKFLGCPKKKKRKKRLQKFPRHCGGELFTSLAAPSVNSVDKDVLHCLHLLSPGLRPACSHVGKACGSEASHHRVLWSSLHPGSSSWAPRHLWQSLRDVPGHRSTCSPGLCSPGPAGLSWRGWGEGQKRDSLEMQL